MKGRGAVILLLAGAAVLSAGCVERRMLIRSDPAGAPVWVDEQYAGLTPVDRPVAHYGWRRIRIGPIRDASDKVKFREKQIDVDISAPWYETFPIDFFFEVLYPGHLADEHALPVFVLDSMEGVSTAVSKKDVEKLRKRAAEFRKRALYTVPEAEPGR